MNSYNPIKSDKATLKVGKYLSLADFCTCSQTYQTYQDKIDPYPQATESITAIQALNTYIIDPIIEHFGQENFRLTYGFSSRDLKGFLTKKDPNTGQKNGRIDPTRDQHMAHEINRKGNYYCQRLGAACDFIIINTDTSQVIDWIVSVPLPFDSLYYYANTRPIHISYGPENKQAIWTFTAQGTPTRKGTEKWQQQLRSNSLS